MRHSIVVRGMNSPNYNSFRPARKVVFRIYCPMSGENWFIELTGAANGIDTALPQCRISIDSCRETQKVQPVGTFETKPASPD